MDTRRIDLKFESNGKIIKVGKGESFRLLNIEGIESGENQLFISPNVLGDGSNVTQRQIKDRHIAAEVEYVGRNKEMERRKLINFFNMHNEGELTVSYGEVKLKVEYIPQSFKSNLENVNKPLKFLVDLYCPDPFFKDIIETKEDVAIWQPSFEFPLEILEDGIEMGYREPSLIVNIFNKGDVPCGMKIHFKALATVINPSLFNINTREYFKINKTMERGEVITVTTHFQSKRVILNKNGVKANAFNWIDLNSTFLQLDTGDNLFRYDADDGVDNLEVSIYYSPMFLGV